MTIRVLIADDNSFIREGLKIILQTYEDVEILDAVENGQDAVDYCKSNKVDVVLLDVRMPLMNGVEAAKEITTHTHTLPIILTTFDDEAYILDAIMNGARGYLLKNTEPENIKEAIKSVYNGSSIMQEGILDKIKANLSNQTTKQTDQLNREDYTNREWDIMTHIAKGYSNKEIAKALFISEGTIANYISTILSKTGLQHRTQIAIYFLTGNKEWK